MNPDAENTTGPQADLSVIVCSHNGERTLHIALGSLQRQTLPPDRYEIIVVDDGSTDQTSARARELGARVIRLDPNGGLAAARNAGVSAARASIVAFTDDDCEVDPAWAAELLAGFDDPAVDGVGGRVIPEARNAFLRRFLRTHNPLTPLKAELLSSNGLAYRLALYLKRSVLGDRELPTDLYSVVGANMAFRRDLVYEVGGFDEAFRFGSEEEDLCKRIHARAGGGRLVYRDCAVVTHWFQDSLRDTIRRSRAYGRGNARRSLKHPDARLIVYPFPLVAAIVGSTAVARRSVRIGAAAALLPLVLYPRWLAAILDTRAGDPIVYPYLQLAQEVAAMIGELDGLRAGYVPVPSRHLGSPDPPTDRALRPRDPVSSPE